jgi:hypothetical protein
LPADDCNNLQQSADLFHLARVRQKYTGSRNGSPFKVDLMPRMSESHQLVNGIAGAGKYSAGAAVRKLPAGATW